MINVNQPIIGEKEIRNVIEALLAGEVSGSGGSFLDRFEREFAEYCGCKHGIAVTSGTTALHLALAVLNIHRGDEVLVSASTNIACGIAVAMQNGIVVPIDSESDTWCMDADLLEEVITPHTKAIMPVHLYGHPVDMDRIRDIADRHDLYIVEDCAEAHGARYYDRRVGGIGDLGCFSFYANKIITTGEGGMIVTNDDSLAERARLLRNLAFTTPRFLHKELGFNYRMTNLQAALGVAQLNSIDSIIQKKRAIAKRYRDNLQDLIGLQLPVEKSYAESVYWIFGVIVKSRLGISRDDLMRHLAEMKIETRTMFCPLNLQPALRPYLSVPNAFCPTAERMWEQGLYLPSGANLTMHDVDRICDTIHKICPICA